MRNKIIGYHWPHHCLACDSGNAYPKRVINPSSPETPEQIADGFNFRRHLTCRPVDEGFSPSRLPGDRFRKKYLDLY